MTEFNYLSRAEMDFRDKLLSIMIFNGNDPNKSVDRVAYSL